MKKQHKFLFKIIILLCCGLTNHLSAMDQLTGTVTFNKGSQRFQVRFYSGKTSRGTSTDAMGNFKLSWPDSFPATLIVRCTGYKSKGILFTGKTPAIIKINLASGDTLETVNIIERRPASEFSFISLFSSKTLHRMAYEKRLVVIYLKALKQILLLMLPLLMLYLVREKFSCLDSMGFIRKYYLKIFHSSAGFPPPMVYRTYPEHG